MCLNYKQNHTQKQQQLNMLLCMWLFFLLFIIQSCGGAYVLRFNAGDNTLLVG